MLSAEQIKAISLFLLDCAKIIFASMVVGVFVPSASGEIPWLTFVSGLVLTSAFFMVGVILSKQSFII